MTPFGRLYVASDRRSLRLGDHCSKVGSGATPRGGESVYTSAGVALIRSQNIYNDRFERRGLAHIDDDAADRLRIVTVEEGDVLLNITGDSVARVFRAPRDILPARVNQHVAIIRPLKQDLDARYLQYYLRSPEFQDFMLGIASSGGTRNALTKAMIEDFEVVCPPLSEQRRVGALLAGIDDRIELARRESHVLDRLLQRLFQSWFVDFDPVVAAVDGRPATAVPPGLAKLFPAEFESSDLGATPAGWSMTTLRSLSGRPQYGFTASAVDEPTGPKLLRITDMNKQPWIDWDEVPYCECKDSDRAKYRLHRNDVLVSRMADVGKACIIEDDAVDAVFASYLIRFPFDASDAYFAYYFLRSPAFIEYADSAAGGTVQSNMNAQVILDAPLPLPPAELRAEFGRLARRVRAKIDANLRLIKRLADTRERLLPELIGGDLRMTVEKA